MTPSVFDYLDFRVFIADAQKAIKAKKPCFTYRYIAERVGMKSPGHITWIIQGKRNLSKKKIPLFAQIIGLDAKETEFFIGLVHFNQAKTHVEKKQFLDALVRLQEPQKAIVQPASYEFYSKWYHSAIRELVAVKKINDDFRRIAHLLQPAITPKEAQQSIELLCRLGLIEKNKDGLYKQVKQAISTGDIWHSVAVRQFQMDSLDLAKGALNSVDAKQRDISTITMSISEERFNQICQRIKQFRNELISLATSDTEPTGVYQLALALFPLSNKERE